jgi:hypothetical protein
MVIKKMIQTLKEKASETGYIFKTNRGKLIRIILEKITLLDMLFYKSKSYEHRAKVRLALEKLENLLKIQGFVDQDINRSDYKQMKKFIELSVQELS